jgi:hypothetical protein
MELKAQVAPFAIALVVFALAFLLLDLTVMNMQGLKLIYPG